MEDGRVKKGRAVAAALIAAFVFWKWRAQCLLLARLALGGGVIAFLISPACLFLSSRLRLNRSAAVLASYLLILAAAAGLTALILPPLLAQAGELIEALPRLISDISARFQRLAGVLAGLGLALPDGLAAGQPLLDGTAALGRSIASAAAEFTLMLTLAFYFIRDREAFALQLEMLLPSSRRRGALRLAAALRQEIGAYLRCQVVISLAVAALASFLLMLCGVKAFLALGAIVGLFNLIPYFGPLLGGVPAVLMALPGGPRMTLTTVAALALVQQADNAIISPRVMSAATGLHPALVLAAITVGGSLSGVAGMLFSVPALLALRSLARNWPVPCKNI
ncbi:MAG: AI-2E family transporter [Clostridia bacterium]|nr:AI-2E family transporter [Clostridia bacterium]